MESLVIKPGIWLGKKVLITGHTGFKGSWLSAYLSLYGAKLLGLSQASEGENTLYERANLSNLFVKEYFCDIADYESVQRHLNDMQPEIIMHLAAQPLVSEGYCDPVKTYQTNTLGTINLLTSANLVESCQIILNVTTDKVYLDTKYMSPYCENDALGGLDPYSQSKAFSDMMSESFAKTYLKNKSLKLATARAGNIIGGGDHNNTRLLPALLDAYSNRNKLAIRNPSHIRPWQYVLDALRGYILLVEYMSLSDDWEFSAWNFGPTDAHKFTVKDMCNLLSNLLGEDCWFQEQCIKNKETASLMLDSSKAQQILGWETLKSVDFALEKAVFWANQDTHSLSYFDEMRHELNDFLSGIV